MALIPSAVAPAQYLLGQVRESSMLTDSGAVLNQFQGSQSDSIDLLTVTASELQERLTAGTTSTMELVQMHLDQMDKHNHKGLKLYAMISTAPVDLLTARAKELDDECAKGSPRGPLHGIPIVVKNNIMTDSALGMDTTCGSYALVGAKAKNAPIVDRILKAGMIIVGKANLSERAGAKGFGVTTGWSTVGGQTQSPYVRGGVTKGEKLLLHSTPAGSSSGSYVAVAAGFSPLSLATETDGSIVQPAGRASLYGIIVTVGALSTQGTSPLSPLTDSLGAVAKSTHDLASVIGVMMGTDYRDSLTGSWNEQRIAFVDPLAWELHPFKAEIDERIDTMRKAGARVVKDVVLPQCSELAWKGEDALETLWNHDYKKAMDSFLSQCQELSIHTMEDPIQFNLEHADKELPPSFPGQQQLENSLKSNITDEEYTEIAKSVRLTAKTNGFDRIFTTNDVDLLMGPLDGRIVTMAAATGYPVSVVPLGYADEMNGRAYGVTMVAAAGGESRLFQAMSAWEKSMPERKPPPQLKTWSETEGTANL